MTPVHGPWADDEAVLGLGDIATEGIQRGHMALHARSVAATAGAAADEVDFVAEALIRSGNIKVDEAQNILSVLRQGCQDK